MMNVENTSNSPSLSHSSIAATPPVAGGESPISSDALKHLNDINAYWASKERETLRAFQSGVALVAVGDSWFDYRVAPDVIDWLKRDFGYEISNVAKAGATTYEMAYGLDKDQSTSDFFGRDPSQLAEVVRLIRMKRPRAVLLSGAGNDFAGPEFVLIIRHALAESSGINRKVFEAILSDDIEPAYRLMIETIAAAGREAGLGDLPILMHGYDYPYPDGRRVSLIFGLITVGPWLHDSFEKKGYPYQNEKDLRRRYDEVRLLIDMLYEMLERLRSSYPNVHVVDVRNTLSDHSQWHNELHPNAAGFRLVAKRFGAALDTLGLDGKRDDVPQECLDLKWIQPGENTDAVASGSKKVEISALASRKAPSLAERRDEYLRLFDSCKVRDDKRGDVAWYRARILRGRSRYELIERQLGIPWYFVAILHSLEASNDFTKHLHNGDPLVLPTVRVPKGRPAGNPPFTWEQSAHDALTLKNFHQEDDWSLEAILYRFEKYNGWGYAWKGLRSPYLWSFSQHYSRGKYVWDGVYNPNAISKQAGAAVLLKDLKSKGVID